MAKKGISIKRELRGSSLSLNVWSKTSTIGIIWELVRKMKSQAHQDLKQEVQFREDAGYFVCRLEFEKPWPTTRVLKPSCILEFLPRLTK